MFPWHTRAFKELPVTTKCEAQKNRSTTDATHIKVPKGEGINAGIPHEGKLG